MEINLLVARGKNNVIGINGELPWHLSADLKRFKKITMGSPIIMGRKTHESIGKPLPGRDNIILTKQISYHAVGCEIFHSFESILTSLKARNVKSCSIIGGASIYALALPYVTRLYITEVDAEPEGDVFFPEMALDDWKEESRDFNSADAKNDFDYSFVTYKRLHFQA